MQMNGHFKNKRIVFLGFATVLAIIIILIRYASLASEEAPQKLRAPSSIQRGIIYDRNGKYLAVSINTYTVGVTPSMISDKAEFAAEVAPILADNDAQIEAEKRIILEKISDPNKKTYVELKKKVSQERCDALRTLCDIKRYKFMRFDRIGGRNYPEKALASQVIGWMGIEGKGVAGIELTQNSQLSPAFDPSKPDNIHGNNIYLTIDAKLQFDLEKIATQALTSTQAESLMLVAAEAKTGRIISYISLPSTDLNEYSSSLPVEKQDLPATQSYEPGSVFKLYSVASFLDTKSITEDQRFYCDGIYEKTTNKGERIKITCLEHHGSLTARDALKYSCNDALAQMSDGIDSEVFLERIRSFGFGGKTGTEVPYENPGLVRKTSDRLWSGRSKPTIAMGQETTVNALQMVQAATALANGGIPVQLTLIDKITDYAGNVKYSHTPVYKDRVIRQETAKYLLSCMETVAKEGTGHRANLGDISIGVKTGTAQMADTEKGGYSDTDFISNCMAVFPVEKPEIILYIVIVKAKGENYAGRIVAPVIHDAANSIIDYLGMSRGKAASLEHSGKITISQNNAIVLDKILPDFTGTPKRQLLPLLENGHVQIKINGDGYVSSQNPPPGTPLTENMEIELYLE